jgi:hypothetical protein
MGGSTDAFALYLSLFQVSRPTDASKPSTSLAFHKEAESKFEFGTSTLKTADASPKQEELLSYEEVKQNLDEEKEKGRVVLETEVVQANPTARGGRRLGGEPQEVGMEEGQREVSTVQGRREMAVRAAERRVKEGEAREVKVGA